MQNDHSLTVVIRRSEVFTSCSTRPVARKSAIPCVVMVVMMRMFCKIGSSQSNFSSEDVQPFHCTFGYTVNYNCLLYV